MQTAAPDVAARLTFCPGCGARYFVAHEALLWFLVPRNTVRPENRQFPAIAGIAAIRRQSIAACLCADFLQAAAPSGAALKRAAPGCVVRHQLCEERHRVSRSLNAALS